MRVSLGRLALAAGVLLSLSCDPSHQDGEQRTAPGPEQGDVPPDQLTAAELTAEKAALARWSGVINLPLVPVSAANLPDGRLLMWSAEDRFNFSSDTGRTYTLQFDPATLTSSERLVSETAHDMFCPGTANLADGRILVNGGLSSGKTSLYNPQTNTWTAAAAMTIPRAYQGTAPLADGSVLTLGGSWAGGVGNKHAEVWTEATGWRRLAGVPIDPFLSFDATRNFGMDSHLWLLPTGNGRVFHAGPGVNMNWIDTNGQGSVQPAGRRGDDEFSINGNTVMFEQGKILKSGGGPGYEGVPANSNSYVIDVRGDLTVRKVPMAYRRAFHNSVVLPNGQVIVIGGMTLVQGFSDSNAVLAPELYDPATGTFTPLPPMSVPRNYHSLALLLPDGRVVSAGGGLCGTNCAANHANLQILSPHYLYNADGTPATRPVIQTSATSAAHGTTIAVSADSAIASFAIVRSSSTTHAVNNDQRRLALTFRETSPGQYTLDIPQNPGWAVPGLYMLFGMNADGVPSLARTLLIGAANAPRILAVADQSTTVGASTELAIATVNASGANLTFSAESLPPGLAIDPVTGTIAGTASLAGRFRATVRVTDGLQTVATELTWHVNEPGTTRFVRLEALSEINGNAWASAAELNLLDGNGVVISQGGFTATADSAEMTAENDAAANAVDGNPATFWHTQWQAASPPPPHFITVDLGGSYVVSGLRYLPRQTGSTNGTIAQYRVSLSPDGVTWSAPVAQGSFAALGGPTLEKTIYFSNVARAKTATQSSTSASSVAARAVDGNTSGLQANASLSVTNAEASPYWEVDLGASYQTYAVRLWPRTDSGTTPAANLYVLASESPMAGRSLAALLADATVAGVQVPGTVLLPQQLLPLASRARYVRVHVAPGSANIALTLAEVEVYGRLGTNRAPTINPLGDQNNLVGNPLTLVVSGSDPDADPLSYSAQGLPPGLAMSAAGVISGSPTTEGNYDVTVRVDDGRGANASVDFVWFVGVAPPAVGRVIAPLLAVGGTAAYTADATGSGPFVYNWNFGDGTPETGFGADYAVTHRFTQAGVYTVSVTIQNPSGAAVARTFLQAVSGPVAAGLVRSSGSVQFEIRSGQNPRIWLVNSDNASVSVFDAVTRAKVREIAVGAQPRSLSIAADGRVWVANKGANTLSVINPSTFAIAQTYTMPRGSQPYGVLAAADGNIYVTLEATGLLLKLNASGTQLASLSLGANIRHLAITPQADRLLVSRFITRFQPGEATGNVQTSVSGVLQGGDVLVVIPSSLTLNRTLTLRHSDKPDTTVSGRGVPNYLGAPAIAPDGASAWVPSKQDNIQRGTLRDLMNLDFQNTVRAVSSRLDLVNQVEDYPARVDHDNAGFASAAAYHPTGAYLFVALETSRQVAVLDPIGRRELFRFDVGRAPSGLVVARDGRTLYVHNFMDRTLGVYSLANLLDYGETQLGLVANLSAVATEALSATVLRGKQFFYDARDTRIARDAYISCASCHNDGAHDGRTWDFTGLGEGLRNTISLRGRAGGQGRLHWSANFDEVHDFEGQLRSLTSGTGLMTDAQFFTGTRSASLGDPKAGVSADLDALSAYLVSLNAFAVSPLRTTAGALTTAATSGRTVFANKCVTCHGGNDFTDSASLSTRNVGTLKSSSGTRLGGALTGLDTPTLRDVWATGPYLHDGSASTLEAAISAHSGLALTATELTNVAAFTGQIGSEEAAVAAITVAGTGLTAQYFNNATLTGSPVLTRTEAVNFNWGSAAPASGVPADNFSARWTGKVAATSTGTYRFRTISDQGVRVTVGTTLVIDNWTSHTSTTNTSGSITLTAGQRYDIVVEYYERTGSALMQLQWSTPSASYAAIPAAQLYPAGLGLRGDYFANESLSGSPTLTRTEAVDFVWGTAAPAANLPVDNFSVRWTGRLIAPSSGQYRFSTVSDDGVRLSLNGTRLIDNWTPHGAFTDLSPVVSLVANQSYDIVLEYNDLGGDATARFLWQPPAATSAVAVPLRVLYAP